MKSLKSLAILLLALSVMVSCLCGCEKPGAPSVGDPETAESNSAAEVSTSSADASNEIDSASSTPETLVYNLPITDKNVTLSFLGSYPSVMTMFVEKPYADYPAFSAWSERTGVTIDWVTLSQDVGAESFALMLSSGELPDIFDSSNLSGDLDFYVEEDIILELKDEIQANMPFYLKATEEYEGYANTLGSESNKGYWSVIHSYVKDAAVLAGNMIRQDWLEDLGLDIPVTYDDYYNVLSAFKNQKDANSAYFLYKTGVSIYDLMIAGYGISGSESSYSSYPFSQLNGTVLYGPYTDAYHEYLEMMNKWYSEGLISIDFMSRENANDSVINGECGIWYDTLENLHQFDGLVDDTFKALPIADAVKKEGDKIHYLVYNKTVNRDGLCLSANCDNVELALTFLDYLWTDDGIILMNYGIEGSSFDYDETGSPQFTDAVIHNEIYPAMSLTLGIMTGSNSVVYGITESTRLNITFSDTQLSALATWGSNSGDTEYVLPSLLTLTTEETDLINEKMGDISTFVQEMTLSFIVGDTPLDDFSSYQEKLQQLGVETCIAQYQSALDRYNNK